MSAPAFEQGEMMGKMVGYLIPEILLAVFSGTIGTWIKAGITAFKSSKFVIKAIKSARWLIDLGKQLFKSFGKIAEKIVDIAEGAFKAVGEGFKKLLDLIKGLLKWEDELPEGALGKTDEVADLGKTEKKLKEFDKVNDAEKKKLKGEAEKDAKEGGMDKEKDFDEKMAALLEAKAITMAADAVEPSMPAILLVKTLNKTIPYKGVTFYQSKPSLNGLKVNYTIWMKGSTVRVGKFDYEIPDLNEKNGDNFYEWFNNISPDEFDKLWQLDKVQEVIARKIRKPGKLHEWLMVARANVFKRWGVTMEQIKNFRTLTKELKFKHPITGEIAPHGTNSISQLAHNDLLELIDKCNSYEEFVKALNLWADAWVVGKRSTLPVGLRIK